LLSDWYGDPSLSPSESQEIQTLLSQLAGSVIYSTEHRLETPYMVRAGERLEEIAAEYDVPWQLLAKINGLESPDQLQPGQQLKVLRGPFTATIDLSRRRMTLMLDRRYAGQFTIEVDPGATIEEGTWAVNQKLITPGDVGFAQNGPNTTTDDRSLMLTNPNGDVSQVTIIRSANSNALAASTPTSRVIQLKNRDVEDVFDILSLGSRVVIRR
jgi:LysM repeat protein